MRSKGKKLIIVPMNGSAWSLCYHITKITPDTEEPWDFRSITSCGLDTLQEARNREKQKKYHHIQKNQTKIKKAKQQNSRQGRQEVETRRSQVQKLMEKVLNVEASVILPSRYFGKWS